jgi:outer membrane receptor protein involved in Fe transport
MLGGRAHVEASVFDTRWNNRQRDAVMFACLAGFQKGQAASDGFELSGNAMVGERATIGLEVSYIDARYTHSVESDGVLIVHAGDSVHGGRLPWSLSAFFDYDLPPILGMSLTIHAEDHYHGGDPRRRLESNPDSPFYQQFATSDSSTNILNLRANARVGRADISIFMNNALDSSPVLNRQNYVGGCCSEDLVQSAYTLTPRTVGISATWQF